ncbi:MAG: hypothetical protein A2W26_07610 [Acidobacteria bacterium RBG_16_64_8]|nr:MAG: hypothetical protein A2W26_07610 [Acidobacteria bacterium RBG_16_64_8]
MALITLAVLGVAACGSPLDEARTLERAGDLEGAVTLYKVILADDPKDLEALTGLAVDLLQLKRYDEALPVQEAIVAVDTKDALTRVELAFNYLNHQDQPDKAVRYLTEAVALEPSPKNLTFLAQAQIQAGDPEAAEQNLRKSLTDDPEYAHAYVVLLSLFDFQGRPEDAADLREQARSNGVDLTGTNGG